MQYFPIVLFPLPLLPPSFPPDPLTLCLSLEKRLLRDSNQTWQNKILQNEAKTFILTLDRATQQEENNPKSKKSQRPTHNHSQKSQKNAKLIAIVCMQRTWCKSYAYCFHVCDLLGILLNTEVPVPLVPSLSDFYNLSASSSTVFPGLWGEQFDGDLQSGLSLSI